MNRIYLSIAIGLTWWLMFSCNPPKQENQETRNSADTFKVEADRFADFQILRYKINGFDQLDLNKKKLAYYLYEAALAGRDIYWDQNYKYNLLIRRTLEGILNNYTGDRNTEAFKQFELYAKMVFVSSGIHHPHSRKKIQPAFTKAYFDTLVNAVDKAYLPLATGQTKAMFIGNITPIIFDPSIAPKSVNKAANMDLLKTSATNLYENVSENEAEHFYKSMKDPQDNTPPMYGLNSKLVKKAGKLVEEVYSVNGLYSGAIEKIVYWLKKASEIAEDENQKKALDDLISFYQTGNLKTFDQYNIDWIKDTTSIIDNVNGFIETYDDPLGFKGSYEAVVSMKDQVASKRMAVLAKNAQWFEDNSPILPENKKPHVKGVSYKVITVIVEAGRTAPNTPIGINLPNSNWIRAEYGSKSVSLGNIVDAYNLASSSGVTDEFYLRDSAKARANKYKVIADKIHTALHEVIGHASGRINPGVGSPSETLKNYASALEEARADLVALYFIIDPKLVEMGIIPTTDVGKAEYDIYIKNGLQLQLRRIQPGDNIEEAHLRNRQLVASWVYEKGKPDNVIEKIEKDGKTYFVINDYDKLRHLFGKLLREIQRIKSEGDFEAGKKLIEEYGVNVDQNMLKEVQARYANLHAAPYAGFIQPRLIAVKNGDEITDVNVEYPDNFLQQMLEYGKEYSFLPSQN